MSDTLIAELAAKRATHVEKMRLAVEKNRLAYLGNKRLAMEQTRQQFLKETELVMSRITEIADSVAETGKEYFVVQVDVKGQETTVGFLGRHVPVPETAARVAKWQSIMEVARYYLTLAGYRIIDGHDTASNIFKITGGEDLAGPSDQCRTTAVRWSVDFDPR
jgi:hypothetical protein